MTAETVTSRPPLLLVEDTLSLQMLYRAVLTGAGHEVVVASNAAEGMLRFAQSGAMTVLLDLVLPDRDGLGLMQDMLQMRPEANVIVMTAHGSVNKAVAAMRGGAHDQLKGGFQRGLIPARQSSASVYGLELRRSHKGRSAVWLCILRTVEALQIRIHRALVVNMQHIVAFGENGLERKFH